MRRVYDDTMYEKLAEEITSALKSIKRKEVEKYMHGTMRSSVLLILEKIFEKVADVKLGRDVNTTGIGNNWAHEIIYTADPNEEQIFGVLHMTDDMFGSNICWVSDIDRKRKYESIKI